MGRKALEVGQVSKYVAEILTRRREELGLSLRAIQAKSGVNYMRVQRVLSAENVMTVDELEALAEALEMVGWKIMREAEDRFATDNHQADVIDIHDQTTPLRRAALDPGYDSDSEIT